MLRRIEWALLGITLSGWAVGCTSNPSSGGPPGRPGDFCSYPADCISGVCEGTCVAACTTDSDCAGAPRLTGTCGPDGRCVQSCEDERDGYGGTVCVGGAVTPCSALDDSYCDVCDDKCAGQRCVDGVGCAPLSAVGEECEEDSDCNTNNCSLFAGVCRVPLESACDDTNCDVCITNGSGWSYCSRECGTDVGGVDCPGDRCIGDTADNYFYCRPACNDACPGTCEYTSGGEYSYCDETAGSSWAQSDPPRPLLAACRYDSHCAEGTCLSAPSCDSRSYECYGRRGYCTTECSADADCGDDAHCVQIACPDGVTEGCGMRCLPACDPMEYPSDCSGPAAAECRTLPSASGESVAVCDPRNSEGSYCTRGVECASATCSSSNRCTAAGGSANGASCGTASDCASNNCQGGTCRGTALRGDPCTTNYDCSAGTCVDDLCE